MKSFIIFLLSWALLQANDFVEHAALLERQFVELSDTLKPSITLVETGDLKLVYQFGTRTITIKQGDIVNENVDAIVNAANTGIGNPKSAGGVAGAIFNKALNETDAKTGTVKSYLDDYWAEVNKNYPKKDTIRCATGDACTTEAYALKNQGVEKIIHAVGPDCGDKSKSMSDDQKNELTGAYQSALREANKYNLTSIAFPFISAVIFACNNNEASEIALMAVINYLKQHPESSVNDIRFILFSKDDPVPGTDFKLFKTKASQLYK